MVAVVDHITPHPIPTIPMITDQEVVLVVEEKEDLNQMVQLQMVTEKTQKYPLVVAVAAEVWLLEMVVLAVLVLL